MTWKILGSKDQCPKKMLDMVFEILARCNSAGIEIKVITTDMASDNQALWSLLKIYGRREGHNVLFQSPCEPEKQIVFMPDPPHAIKNLKGASMKYPIEVPVWFFKKYKLDYLDPLTNVQLKAVLQDLVNIGKENKVYYVERVEECLYPEGFEKMRMSFTLNVINLKVVAAIESCVDNG